MKIIIEEDGLYPFYTLTDDYEMFNGRVAELSEKDRLEYNEVMARFWNMQKLLSELYKA